MRFPAAKRIEFYREMISLIRSGYSKEEAVEAAWRLETQDGKKTKTVLARVYKEILDGMRGGLSMGESLSRMIPKSESMVITAIQDSRDFAGSLEQYVEMESRRQAVLGRIKVGMIQPVVLFLLLFVMVHMFTAVLVPNITPLLPMDQWTGRAKILKYADLFRRDLMIPVLAGCVGLAAVSAMSLKRWTGKGRKRLEDTPPWSIYRSMTGVNFFIAISAMIEAGVPVEDAVDEIRRVSEPYMRRRLTAILSRQRDEGENLGEAAMRTGYDWPDPVMNRKIALFAETRDLSETLVRMSRSWVDEIDRRVGAAMASLSMGSMMLVVLLVLALVAGFFDLQGQLMSKFSR